MENFNTSADVIRGREIFEELSSEAYILDNDNSTAVNVSEVKSKHEHSFTAGSITIFVKMTSIWEYENTLDALFVSAEMDIQKNNTESHGKNVYDMNLIFEPTLNNFSKADKELIKELCDTNCYQRIGFTPFGRDYFDLAKSIAEMSIKTLKEIYLFHSEEDDFKYLYKEKRMRHKSDPKIALCTYYTWMSGEEDRDVK